MVSLWSTIVITIVVITIFSESVEGYRILGLFPSNTRSHFAMNRKLMKILAQKGHHVDVVSHHPLKEQLPNYHDYSLQGSLPDQTNNFTFKNIEEISLQKHIETVANPVCGLLKHPVLSNLIKNPPSDPPYDLVIVELVAFHCYLAFGRHLNVPMIGVSTTSLYDWTSEPVGNPTGLAFVPSLFSNQQSELNFWERLHNVLKSRIVIYLFNSYIETQKKFVDENFGPGYPSLIDLTKELSLVFVNSYHALNGVRPMIPGIVEIGGLHIEDTKLTPELKKWLDESTDGCIYVSFGSMVKIESFPEETIKAFYDTFRNIAPVRVLMKIANEEELLPGLPNNVKVHPWLPQTAVLQHKNVKAFVTHGGLMGTIEAIYYGVPMIGIPLFADQFHNLNSCEKNKIAVLVDNKNITEGSLTESINNILKNPEIRRNIEKFSKLYFDRALSPEDTAIFWTEYVIRNGNVLRSPSADLEWWQFELLDVYGFLLFVFLITIYIVHIIFKYLFKWPYHPIFIDELAPLPKKLQ